MTQKVQTERDGDVLVIVIQNPPINAGSIDVRRGILDAIAVLAGDPLLKAGVLIGGGTTFIAGADLREFGQPLEDPQLPAVISAIEACPKPVVAALHGAALGGGFELALGCDARVAHPKAMVGLPEVTLGMVPGAGGTQRLPRIVGAARAISMICTGERLAAEPALELGIVDAIAPGDLRTAAVQFARSIPGKRLLREQSVPGGAQESIDAAAKAARTAGRGRPPVVSAIALILAASTDPIDATLQRERAEFQQFRMSAEAAALRHLFFAEREAARHPRVLGLAPRPFHGAGVVGGGLMGSGIAICLADAGIETVVIERDADAERACENRVQKHYADRVARGRTKADHAAACAARITVSTDWGRLATVDICFEAVFEDMRAKQDVFHRLDAVLRPGAVLATNTSYLDVDTIAASTRRPQDVLGLHFFSPAHTMRLLEIVRGRHTADEVLATGMALAQRLKKQVVVSENAFGFVGNRIFNAYRRQCEFMLEEGATPWQVDAALEAFGFAMGPFAVADMSGLDIAWRMRLAQEISRNPEHRYAPLADKLCELGRLGHKTGVGYYRYRAGERVGQPDDMVQELLGRIARAKGIERRTLGDDEIVRRALLAMANEAACLLSEGVAVRPSDIDVAMVHGYGFPRWEGGPVYWARQKDAATLANDMASLSQVSGPGLRLGQLLALNAATPSR